MLFTEYPCYMCGKGFSGAAVTGEVYQILTQLLNCLDRLVAARVVSTKGTQVRFPGMTSVQDLWESKKL